MYVNSKCVPWYSIAEYRFVLYKLKSSNSDDLYEALAFMHVWSSRVTANKLPRAILCTYELLLARLQKSTQALANAIMRFISLVSSEAQDKNRSGFAIPIYSLVVNAGLPAWMSDMRNEIAHGVLPPEDSLIKGSKIALQWLLRFWESNAEESFPNVDLRPLEEITWISSLGLVDEFLSCPTRQVPVTRAYAKHLVRMAESGCRGISTAELGAVLQVFQKFGKVNDLIFAIYTLFPAPGAVFWANAWLEAFKAFFVPQEHELHQYYSLRDFSVFPWRHCLEQVSLASCPRNFDILSFLALFQSSIPPNIKSSLLSICSSTDLTSVSDPAKPAISRLSWTHDRSERWWRVPLGAKLHSMVAYLY